MNSSFQEYVQGLSTNFQKIEANAIDRSKLGVEEACSRVLHLIGETRGKRRKVIFVGNGGSAAIASHQAVDFWKNGGVRAIAFNDASLLTCISNDFGYEQVFDRPLAMFADEGDLLIAISSSGRSPNILRAVEQARVRGCRVVTLSGFRADNPLRGRGDVNFYVPSESYGDVEISHLMICHHLADQLMAQKKSFVRTETN